MIKHLSLRHGILYQFKIHKEKISSCNEHLQLFLNEMLEGNCPDHKFFSGPRSSSLKFPIEVNVEEIEHPITKLADAGLSIGGQDSAHSNVQMFMLHHDLNTVAVEVPLWASQEEIKHNFEETGDLTGHIDVLRIEPDGKIWVWDFKPNAHREKYASTQTYFYAKMLSLRTGIDLDNFRCGWFDQERAYVFDPNEVRLI